MVQNSIRNSAGFSLLEVVIAMFILAVGILGAGALQTVGMQTTQGAYYRTQAMLIASDIADRMRANRTALSSYAGTDTSGALPADPGCISTGCTPAQLAASDVREWATVFSLSPPIFPANGRGQIVANGGNAFTIQVDWSENEWAQNSNIRALPTSANKSYVLKVNFDSN